VIEIWKRRADAAARSAATATGERPFCQHSVMIALLVMSMWAAPLMAAAATVHQFEADGLSHGSMRFSADGHFLMLVEYAGSAQQVRRFDLTSGRFDQQLSFAVDAAAAFAISATGKMLALVDRGANAIKVVEFSSGATLHTLAWPLEPKQIASSAQLSFSNDDARLIVAPEYGRGLAVATIADGIWSKVETYGKHHSLADSGRVAVAAGFSSIRVQDLGTKTGASTKQLDGYIVDLRLAADGQQLLLLEGGGDGGDAVHMLDATTLAPVSAASVAGPGLHLGSAWSAQGPVALRKLKSGGLTVTNLATDESLFERPDVDSTDVAMSPNGGWLAFARANGVVEVHSLASLPTEAATDLADQREPPRLVPQLMHVGQVYGVDISADGALVALAGDDGWLSLWERRTGRVFRRLSYGTGLRSVKFSRDASRVLVSDLHGNGAVWELASGELVQRLPFSAGGSLFAAFVDNDKQLLTCNSRNDCRMQPLSPDSFKLGIELALPAPDARTRLTFFDVSLTPDASAAAFALGEHGVGWMELREGGKRQVLPLPGKVEAVVALDGDRLAAGLETGEVLILDIDEARVLHRQHTRAANIGAMTRLGAKRIAVASHGSNRMSSADKPQAELFILSAIDLSPQQVLAWNRPTGGPHGPSSAYVDALAASSDGRWLVSASQTGLHPAPLVQIWDVARATPTKALASRVMPVNRLEFSGDGKQLLVDGRNTASLWHLGDGRIARQSGHSTNFKQGERRAALTGDGLVRVIDGLPQRIEHWSARAGIREYKNATEFASFDDIQAHGNTLVALDSESISVFSPTRADTIKRPRLVRMQVDFARAQILADLGNDGLELMTLAGESRWRRNDVPYTKRLAFSVDGAVAIALLQDNSVVATDTATGQARYALQNDALRDVPIRPVWSSTGVHAIVRLSQDAKFERLNAQSGAVIDSHNLGLRSLRFVVADPAGAQWLLVGTHGRSLLWDQVSDKRHLLNADPQTPDAVAFSPDGKLLALAKTDGTVDLWQTGESATAPRRVAGLVTLADGDWAVVDASGRYDASDPGDLEGLAWVLDDAPTLPLPLALFFREYYEPRLLPRLLAHESLQPITSLADIDRTQPQVRVTSVANANQVGQADVTVTIDRNGLTEVHDLKLFRNGQLVAVQTRPEAKVQFRNIDLPTSGSPSVEFSAYAFNADGVKSATHKFHWTPAQRMSPRPRRAFVITVGINAYDNSSWDLRYAAADARVGSDIVARHLQAADTFADIRVIRLVSERDSGGKLVGSATRAHFLAVLDALAGETSDATLLNAVDGAQALPVATPDDLIYIAFSGHGLSGANGAFHLFFADVGGGKKRVLDKALLSRTLTSDTLSEHLHAVDAGEMVMVIDACNSAASIEGAGFKPGPMGSRGLGQLAYDKAMRVLAASQAEQPALESDKLRHGALTFAMLREGLAGAAADVAPQDGAVDLKELLAYGVARVPLLNEELRRGAFKALGRGIGVRPFRPAKNPQTRAKPAPPPQRPSLFDFSRGRTSVRLPVLMPQGQTK